MTADYAGFLQKKAQLGTDDGFAPIWLPGTLSDFQSSLTDWSIRKGKSALYEDCGLGKTFQYLVWAENVVRHSNGNILIGAPLATQWQIINEGEKFGIECHRSDDGKPRGKITVANYEKLHLFDPNDYVGMVADEASILKNFDGVRRQQITDFMRKMKYRLLCSATPAPNEYIELGTSSEALGYLGHMDMLTRFFKNDQNNSIKPHLYRHRGERFALDDSGKWRFKGHAEQPFWRWVCSWARAVRKPSDLGFDDGAYTLPPLVERQHMVDTARPPDGSLFTLPAVGLREQRDERRRTIEERCEKAAQLVNGHAPAIVWCELNAEGDLLERSIPGCVQVSGKDSDEAKEEKFLAFVKGNARVLVTKHKIGAWGLNFQHCAHSVSFPTHSFESYYQSIRRCWRFGQTKSVVSDIVTTEGEKDVLANLQRKSVQADKMFSALVAHMNEALGVKRGIDFNNPMGGPAWL